MSQPVSDHYLCQSKNIQAYFDDELDSPMIGLASSDRSGLAPALQWH